MSTPPQDIPPPANDPPPAGDPVSDPLDPTKITLTLTVSPSPPAWGQPLTLTLTLVNGNTPSYALPDEELLFAPALTYTLPDGTPETVGAPPVTLTLTGRSVSHLLAGPKVAVRLPAYLAPISPPAGFTSADNGDGTYTATLAFADVEGGASQSLSLSLTPDPARVPGATPRVPAAVPGSPPAPAPVPTSGPTPGVAPPPFPALLSNVMDPALAPLYALHNGKERFFTGNATEEVGLAARAGWTYEGVCGFVWPNAGSGRVAVLRAYNPQTGLHLFTLDPVALARFVAAGGRSENVAGYVPDPAATPAAATPAAVKPK